MKTIKFYSDDVCDYALLDGKTMLTKTNYTKIYCKETKSYIPLRKYYIIKGNTYV